MIIPPDDNLKRFAEIFNTERLEIQERRRQAQKNRGSEEPAEPGLPKDLTGLALSGGGIRSATFCLGLLQGLEQLNLLRIFDYLSTVSGGGFVGGWWSAWLSRDVRKDGEIFPAAERIEPMRSVDDYLSTEPASPQTLGSATDPAEKTKTRLAEGSINAGKDPIHHLRLFANYLTPRRGALSLDTWRAVTSFTRNLVLTWLVLLPILVATVLLGQLYFVVFSEGNFPHEGVRDLQQQAVQTKLSSEQKSLEASFLHRLNDARALDLRLGTLQQRLTIAAWPIGIIAGLTLFVAFCWVIGIQSGSKLLRLLNCLIGLFLLVILLVVFQSEPSGSFVILAFLGLLICLISVVLIVFRIPSTLFRLLRRLIRLKMLARLTSQTFATSSQDSAIRPGSETENAADIRRQKELKDRAQEQWRKEVYLNTVTRWTARLAVILVVTTAVLAVSGFGHEAVEYVCCYSTSGETPFRTLLHYLAKSLSLSGVFAALAGLIYTWGKAAPTGGGESNTEKPSAVNQLIFAITPTLVLVVLAVTTAWLAHALVWFVMANPGSLDGLTYATRLGVYLSFVFVVIEIDWAELRPWVGRLIVLIMLVFSGMIVYRLIPPVEFSWARKALPDRIWSLRFAAVIGSLAVFKPMLGRMMNWSLFRKKGGAFALVLVTLILLLSASVGIAQIGDLMLGPAGAELPDENLLSITIKNLTRCGVIYLCLLLLQSWGKRRNLRPYWLVTAIYLITTTLLVMSYYRDVVENPMLTLAHPTLTLARAVILLTTTALAWVIALGWMADPNSLSMHSFYKGRLVRAYLGASNIRRAGRQKEITESVEGDDVLLSNLENCRQGAPYHLINATLNLVGGRDLATAQRSSAMFVLSKHHCGSLRTGYRGTAEYMGGEVSLGTAVAVSGAAVSPNMGSTKTTASLAMLMTLLNVRLGYWAPTPSKGRWRSAQARLWPFYTLREFLSETNDLSSYCYLTDGGHFDNTGLYSLIERGCRCVVVADCSADPEPCFADLGNAIRRCRIDFDTEIDLDVTPLMRRGKDEAFARQHSVVGQIVYSATHYGTLGWKDATLVERTGTLVYIKPALLADDRGLTVDVRQYGIENSAFPQQTTANQWFDEAQFESYRQLGQHSAKMAFANIDLADQAAYKKAQEKERTQTALLPEEELMIAAKAASDRISARRFSSADVLKVFELLYQSEAS